MVKELREIAEVLSGYTFRGAIEPDEKGSVFVLQAKNVSQSDSIADVDNLVKITANIPRSATYLQRNDVVIVSRGMGVGAFRSAVFACDNGDVIASSSVLIIRLKDKEVLPEYISLYLNSVTGQGALSQVVSGAHIQTILRRSLQELPILIPPLKKQELIVKVWNNIKQQEKIANRKRILRKQIFETTFNVTNTK